MDEHIPPEQRAVLDGLGNVLAGRAAEQQHVRLAEVDRRHRSQGVGHVGHPLPPALALARTRVEPPHLGRERAPAYTISPILPATAKANGSGRGGSVSCVTAPDAASHLSRVTSAQVSLASDPPIGPPYPMRSGKAGSRPHSTGTPTWSASPPESPVARHPTTPIAIRTPALIHPPLSLQPSEGLGPLGMALPGRVHAQGRRRVASSVRPSTRHEGASRGYGSAGPR